MPTGSCSRPLVILSLFSLLALVQAIAYFRYFRYLPFFSGIGLLYVLSAVLPQASRASGGLRSAFDGAARPALLIAPGVALAAMLGVFHLLRQPAPDLIPAAEFADDCDLSALARQSGWPAGAIVMAPPNTGIQLLSLNSGPAVIAIPQHPSAKGIERAYRFLDPATADPQSVLGESGATHVALCAWRAAPLPGLAERYPLAAALMEGRAPTWLRECQTDAASPIRLYAVGKPGGAFAACPASGPGPQSAGRDATAIAGRGQSGG